MHRHIGRKVLATLAAAGVVAGTASTADAASRGRESSPRLKTRIFNHHDQDADVFLGVLQGSSSNTGHNAQGNVTAQGNSADQDADSNANGGNALGLTLSRRRGPSSSADANAAAAETVVETVATGGDGGEADAYNAAGQENEAESSNALSTGDAEAINEASVAVDQTQGFVITNTITQNIEAALASATAGGATATLPVFPEHVEATIVNNVDQDADATVIVAQGADANTGGNVQGNITLQGNDADQESDADANGGDAVAVTVGSASSDADGTTVAAASTEVVSDALGGDGGEAVAENVAEQSNSSDSSNAMATGDATAGNVAEIEVSQDLSADILSEVETELATP